MSKCIKCGQELTADFIPNPNVFPPLIVSGFHCNNPDCELNNKKKDENNWNLEKHKDSQEWAVRHIRALEAQLKELSESILVLQKKVLS